MNLISILRFFQAYCTVYFRCEYGIYPPFRFPEPRTVPQRLVSYQTLARENARLRADTLALTKLGPVQGFKMRTTRNTEIVAFNGVPYGEPPGRFMPPEPKRPWHGVWQATSKSPFCLQRFITDGAATGQEDCLHLDIYTPKLPKNSSSELYPVLMWLPAGANFAGRSRDFGPSVILAREDVVLVVINTRMGVYGFLSAGEETGNWALKDQALAVEWVHSHIQAFGGNPNKIAMGGVSSAGFNTHLMLFTTLPARNYLQGLIALGGTVMIRGAIDTYGRMVEATNNIARKAGCPEATGGKASSRRTVECLRKVEPYLLIDIATSFRFTSWAAVVERQHPTAFMTELPEVQYEKGLVPPIPLIVGRTRDEGDVFARLLSLPPLGLLSPITLPLLLRVGYRNGLPKPTFMDTMRNLRTLNRFYFDLDSYFPPLVYTQRYYAGIVKLIDDMYCMAGMWKSIEMHHKVAPTFTYIYNYGPAEMLPPPFNPLAMRIAKRLRLDGALHGSDTVILFNNTRLGPPIKDGTKWDKIASGLINLFRNFADYGHPYLLRGGQLIDPWKPVTDMRNPLAFEIGLEDNNLRMVKETFVGSDRQQIWEQVAF